MTILSRFRDAFVTLQIAVGMANMIYLQGKNNENRPIEKLFIMKKISITTLFAAFLLTLLTSSCQRNPEEGQVQEQVQEGVYNPSKKIDRIFSNWRMVRQVFSPETNSWETVEQVDGPLASSEIWQWNGDELESIRGKEIYPIRCDLPPFRKDTIPVAPHKRSGVGL